MGEFISKIKQHHVFVVYILGFLFALHGALPAYINSSFLSRFTTEEFVGMIYTMSSIASLVSFVFIHKILEKFGNYKTTLFLLCLEFISVLGLAIFSNPLIIVPLFLLGFVAISLIGFTIDVVLESYSKNEKTGEIRGWFLTNVNMAWVFAPAISSFVLTNGDYWKIYLASAIFILPVIYLFSTNMKGFVDPEYPKIPFSKSLQKVWADKDIFSVFAANFMLQFFFAWMVIYTPIYLHEHIGMAWQQIGIVFSIMLFPFVLTEGILGKLADQRFGEKEIMAIGFIIMAISTSVISFIVGANVVVWAVILFITRIGASMVEVMTETYFFKKVSGSDIGIISMFRTIRPISYIVGPIIATMLLTYVGIKFIFIILGLLMFIGLRYSLEIEDTK